MKIYTKTGDKGMTKLVGGDSVAKDSDRVESYGTIDELNSWVGLIVAELPAKEVSLAEELRTLQQLLFDLGTDLSTPASAGRPLRLLPGAATWLENRIDVYTEEAPDIDRFILPGGSKIASMLHVARTITRRGERIIVRLSWTASLNKEIIIFVNRLSDYFFAVARAVNARENKLDIFYERSEQVFHKIKSDGL
ncbi:cob(I)alamin adenosyltransferase [Enterococcus sp. PF1-24]|uniref:cob(I)yrinic acid a,c-diamide adenosyltransferase n=1 Tax=unclassified Enterococcus TaxID=2608891 RepID=UPI002474C085|nr:MULTISPECIES: cob(I)yrinic acid a,c-diamide adenosyltransferase [unclassified Enterococcus]MDH6363334.1 cob(I)alamin adenosyltransferase [Enterococcus sp. PFB1-1]MDH6400365.1 cob(I)alamin adenosyltransferase [Enterococcus sp. PF1-24]